MAKDPVCGMKVDPKKAAGKSAYKGETVYFCSLDCKAKFDKEPERFAMKGLEQNIAGEQCAISTYHSIIEEVGIKDPVTYNLVSQILTDEVEHEEDLQALLEDLGFMLKGRV